MLAERAQSEEVAVHDEGRVEELDAENEDDCDIELQPLLQRVSPVFLWVVDRQLDAHAYQHGRHRVHLPQEGDQRVVHCCRVEHRVSTLFHLDVALIEVKGFIAPATAIVRLNGFGRLSFSRL